MQTAIQRFRKNIESVHKLDALYVTFDSKITPIIDLSEILRAEIVLGVSALDCLIHDLVRIWMLNIFQDWQKWIIGSKAFCNFPISMECLKNIDTGNSIDQKVYFLDQEIRRVHGYKTFQEPDKISSALSLIWIQSIWVKMEAPVWKKSKEIQNSLSVVIERRNQIAHEWDIDPVYWTKRTIDRISTVEALEAIVKICENLYPIVLAEI